MSGNDTQSRWYVPITWTSNLEPDFENTTTRDWLLPIGFVEIPLVVNNQVANWVVLNNQVTGKYQLVIYTGMFFKIQIDRILQSEL